ncbi:MAG: hypothetical protein FWC43_00810 [Planctomycetaceae bacterium]|nr:hypothetical protein [Planctomycetaceae bacterium]
MSKTILIADSGSTKADWRLITPEAVESYATPGLNPYLHTDDGLFQEIDQNLQPKIHCPVDKIYFYGAGVANEEKAELLRQTLRRVFLSAQTVEAYSDLFGAARALCGTRAGIVCILGTGSNSCYYDGQTQVDHVPPCGYILGDEGSGAVLGRKLLSAFLKRALSTAAHQKLIEQHQLTKDEILEQVYKKPFPNRYLAGFAIFMRENLDDESIAKLIETGFEEFLDRNVVHYPQHKELPIHFTGSIAFYFKEPLEKILRQRQLQLGRIIQTPADDLAEFHRDREYVV